MHCPLTVRQLLTVPEAMVQSPGYSLSIFLSLTSKVFCTFFCSQSYIQGSVTLLCASLFPTDMRQDHGQLWSNKPEDCAITNIVIIQTTHIKTIPPKLSIRSFGMVTDNVGEKQLFSSSSFTFQQTKTHLLRFKHFFNCVFLLFFSF